jgi:cysteine-rich repeat protein
MRAIIIAGLLAGVCLIGSASHASDITGTVSFEGTITFSAPIPGITFTDLTVAPRLTAEATGNGEHCDVNSIMTDSPDGTGAYPNAGTVSVNITIGRGGPMAPDGQCILTIHATGTDGVSTSARGSQTVFLDVADISGNVTLTGVDIVVRQSKAVAGLDADCIRWAKKQMRVRARCNFLLLKLGPSAVCKDFSLEEPPNCDPGQHVEAVLALGHGGNDQQTDPPSAEAVDFADMLHDQVICQKLFGRAAFNFAAKRSKLVDRLCVDANADSQACRDARSQDSKPRLDAIDRCGVDQIADPMTGRLVPQVGAPCDPCIDGLGNIDRKCLKGCFQTVLDEISDGLVGDVPVCGNGILQPGEFCDDGNTSGADCCSATCTVVANTPVTEGPMGDGTCSDSIDNDCDNLTDANDPSCQ